MKGTAHGNLLKDEINSLMNQMWCYAEANAREIAKIVPIWVANLIREFGMEEGLFRSYEYVASYVPEQVHQELKSLSEARV